MLKGTFYIIFSLFLLSLLVSCSEEGQISPSDESLEKGEKVFLSFQIKNAAFSQLPSTQVASRGTVIDDNVEESSEEGIPNENRMNNLWILLYSKGINDATSLLKYRFKFTFDGTVGTYTETEGQISGPYEVLDGYCRTSVKLVEPGAYRLVAVSNTTFPRPLNLNEGPEVAYDIMEQNLVEGNIQNYYTLKATTNRFWYEINKQIASCDRRLGEEGIFVYHVDDSFQVSSNYTSPQNPLEKHIGMKRWLSKLRVTFTNMGEDGTVSPFSPGYRLQYAELRNYFNSNKLFEWDMHNYGSTNTGYNTGNLSNSTMFQENFPLLEQLNSTGTTADAIPETELFNHYITGYNNALPMQDADNYQYIRLVFTQVSTGKDFQYDIPIYNRDDTPCPTYISADKYTKYTILRNTIYELRIRFKGPTIEVIDIIDRVKEYESKEVNIPSFN